LEGNDLGCKLENQKTTLKLTCVTEVIPKIEVELIRDVREHEQRFFLEDVKALEHRWEKCVALRGDYVEKL
jgi:hypothetical protein